MDKRTGPRNWRTLAAGGSTRSFGSEAAAEQAAQTIANETDAWVGVEERTPTGQNPWEYRWEMVSTFHPQVLCATCRKPIRWVERSGGGDTWLHEGETTYRKGWVGNSVGHPAVAPTSAGRVQS